MSATPHPSRWLARQADLAAATRPLRDRLRRDDRWTDRHATRHAIAAIDREYAAAIVAFLERRARMLHAGELAEYLLAPEPHGDQASLALEHEQRELADTDPLTWLRATPVMRALTARAHTPMTTTPREEPTT